jgi:formyl-CoA transferase
VRHFADWGANVIRIEPPASEGEDVAGRRHGFDFQNLHRNKRAITLNLKTPEGHAAFMRLAKTADVILENMRAQVKHRLKVSYDDVKAINPRIVYGSISGFGQDGPYGHRAGVDQIAQGMGGLMSITGEPGRGPMRVGIPIDDLTAGNLLALGCMMAIFDRERTGVGRWVTTSLLEAQIFMLDFQASRWLMENEVAGQAGNDHPTGIPTGVFPTSDGHINIAASSGRVFARFCEAIERPDWLEKEDWKTQVGRSKARKEINAAIGEITKTKPAGQWNTVRADLQHRPDLRRSAGETSGHGADDAQQGGRRQGSRCVSDQHIRLLERHPPGHAGSQLVHRRDPAIGRLHAGRDRRHAQEGSDLMDAIVNGGASVQYAGGKMLAAKEDGIGLITFNQPEKRNAMSVEMWVGLGEILDEFSEDSDVRVVILTGAGNKAFVSGADISQFDKLRSNADAQQEYDRMTGIGRKKFQSFRKPTIARIRGFCLGGGLALAMQTDLRIAAVDSQFGIPAARLSIAYAFDGLRNLVNLVGPAHARMILYTGSRIDATEAERIGLINRMVVDEDLNETVLDIARTIADNAPLSVAASKFTITEVLKDPGDRDMAEVARLSTICFDSDDYKEGRRAFMEKRAPVFRGR